MKTQKNNPQNGNGSVNISSMSDLVTETLKAARNGHRIPEITIDESVEVEEESVEPPEKKWASETEFVSRYPHATPEQVRRNGDLRERIKVCGNAETFDSQEYRQLIKEEDELTGEMCRHERQFERTSVRTGLLTRIRGFNRGVLGAVTTGVKIPVLVAGALGVAAGYTVRKHARRGVEFIRGLAQQARVRPLDPMAEVAQEVTGTVRAKFTAGWQVVVALIKAAVVARLLRGVITGLKRVPVTTWVTRLGPAAVRTAVAYPRATVAVLAVLRLTAGFMAQLAATVLISMVIHLALRGLGNLMDRLNVEPVPTAA